MTRHYKRPDPQTLRHYTRHVSAMTAENLHEKSEIAAELAWRDERIDELRAEVERLLAVKSAASALEKQLPAGLALKSYHAGKEVAELRKSLMEVHRD